MPQVFTKHIANDVLLYVWENTESLDELIELAQLTTDESKRLNSFKTLGRKREWTAIRALLNSIFQKKVHVHYVSLGKPKIDSAKHVSFSHTKGYVMVVVSNMHTVGADCEVFSSRVLSVKERVLNNVELRSLKKDSEILQVLVYWCLKEVLFKISPTGEIDFRKDIQIDAFEPCDNNLLNGEVKLNEGTIKAALGYQVYKDILLTWGVQKD